MNDYCYDLPEHYDNLPRCRRIHYDILPGQLQENETCSIAFKTEEQALKDVKRYDIEARVLKLKVKYADCSEGFRYGVVTTED